MRNLFSKRKEEAPVEQVVDQLTLSEADKLKIATVIIPRTIFEINTKAGVSNQIRKVGVNPELIEEVLKDYYSRVNHNYMAAGVRQGIEADAFRPSFEGVAKAAAYQSIKAKDQSKKVLVDLWETFVFHEQIRTVLPDELAEALVKARYKIEGRTTAEWWVSVQRVAVNLIYAGLVSYEVNRSLSGKGYVLTITPEGLKALNEKLSFSDRRTHLPSDYKHTAGKIKKYQTAHTQVKALPKKELKF